MAAKTVKQMTFLWEGKDKKGKIIKGEIRASGEAVVNATLRRQGITVTKVKNRVVLLAKVRLLRKTSPYLHVN